MKFLKSAFLSLMMLAASSVFAQNPQQPFSTGNITATAAGCTLANNTGCVVLPLPNSNRISVAITVSGTFSGTLNFVGMNTGPFPFSAALAAAPCPGGAAVTTTTGTGTWIAPSIGGLTAVGVRASAISGTATVTITSSTVQGGSSINTGNIVGCDGTAGAIAFDNGIPNSLTCLLPLGANGTFLETDGVGGLLWAATVNSGSVSAATACMTFYTSAANTATGTVVTCDMLGSVGADLGAKMNACATALPAAGGICKGDNLPAQTLSTAVTTAKAVVYTFCGQAISQTGAVTLNAANSAIEGCAGKKTTFTKAASIDQITLSAANVSVRGITLAGVKASFTGNGIVTAAGALQAVIENNVISGEAGDDIKDNSATFSVNLIRGNLLSNWGLHGYESTSNAQQSIFSGNYMAGDGTATGAGITNTGASRLLGNYIKYTDNSQVLVDDSGASQAHAITGNTINNPGTAVAFKGGAHTSATANAISTTGGTGPAVQLAGSAIFTSNVVNATNADGIDVSQGSNTISNNIVAVSISTGVSHFAINFTGDQIGNRTSANQLTIADSANLGNVDACIQNNPSGTHNLGMLFSGDMCNGLNSGSVTVYGFFLNNSNNLNTNWSQVVRDLACVHITACLKRTDTQNQISSYIDIQQGDTTLDAGTGSTNDVFVLNELQFTFVNIPTPIGNGSRFYCTNCTQAKPTAAGGGGAWVVREAGANNGL